MRYEDLEPLLRLSQGFMGNYLNTPDKIINKWENKQEFNLRIEENTIQLLFRLRI